MKQALFLITLISLPLLMGLVKEKEEECLPCKECYDIAWDDGWGEGYATGQVNQRYSIVRTLIQMGKKILHELDLNSGETIEFAKLNAGVVQPSKTGINPYYLGIKMYEDIEERYNNPTEEMKRVGIEPGSGREKIFEVRELESDISFLRNYLTKELVMREDLYLFQKQGRDYKIVDKNWKQVRDQLVGMRVNGGFPYITVNDGDYLKNGELYMQHWYEGIELDVKYLEKVLP